MYFQYLKEIYHLASVVSKSKIIAIILIMFCLSFLELASIGLILPYIDIASNASNNSSVIKEVLSIFKLDLSRNEILIAGGFLLIALFIIFVSGETVWQC